ncbi:MAG: trehalose-phosphatase [Steroidobacteraceae bacterium]|jgi:trehalose 6-phosphate phosphatase|nr:trehalose-phosphatase [Steroidobacteraceae bacterium]
MLPPIPHNPALFIDVDGTLLEIAARPEDVRVDQALLGQLRRIQQGLSGAVALLSGRPIEQLSRLFAPLELPMAGLHGVERRAADGRVTVVGVPQAAIDHARGVLRGLVEAHAGLMLEDKSRSVAVHYRRVPRLEPLVEQACGELVKQLGEDFHVQRGLLVREIKPRAADKGTALQEFMSEEPFRHRRPVAIGDDVTDEDAFRAAERCGGFSIAVSDPVRGRLRLPGPRALRGWLTMLAEQLARPSG